MSPKEWAFPDVEEAKKLAEDLKVRPSSKEIVIMPNEAEPKPPIKAPVKVDFAAMRAKWGDFGGPATTYALFGYGGIIKQTHALSNQMMAFFSERAAGAAAVRHLAGKGVDVSKMFSPNVWPVTAMTPGDDALIDRTRATVAKQFLESDNEVLLMIDHDIEWVNASHETGYEGDPLHLCRLAAETRGTVGAIISKKVIGQGIASMFGDAITTPIGQDGAFSSPVVGSGMTAYHRDVVEDVWETMLKWECLGRIPAPGYVPIFMPNLALHPNAPGDLIVNSEDWAFCERGRRLGYVSYLATRPKTGHWGQYKYEVDKDAAPQQPVAAPAPVPPSGQGLEPAAVPRGDHGGGAVDLSEIKISLLHATRGRPEMALAAHDKWVEMASGEVTLEYIFSIDDDDPTNRPGTSAPRPSQLFDNVQAQVRIGLDNRGNVDAYNRAAWVSTGQVLVQVHDDVTPPQDWDLLILDKIQDVTKPALIHVNDGTPPGVNADKKGWLPTIAILTRAFAEKVGGMWYPGYISLFCDDDLGQKAILDGVFVDAPDIVFKHDWQGAERDETQMRSYSQYNGEHGERLFLTRKAAGFPDGVWGEVVK